MKVFFGILFVIVLGVSVHSFALEKLTILTIKCNAENVNCPPLPLPPSPPAAPSPPSLPSAPIPPEPPVPPAVPELIVPTQAHLACVGKAIGTEITWEYENKSTMTGVCGERDGKPYLKLIHAHFFNKVFNQTSN